MRQVPVPVDEADSNEKDKSSCTPYVLLPLVTVAGTTVINTIAASSFTWIFQEYTPKWQPNISPVDAARYAAIGTAACFGFYALCLYLYLFLRPAPTAKKDKSTKTVLGENFLGAMLGNIALSGFMTPLGAAFLDKVINPVTLFKSGLNTFFGATILTFVCGLAYLFFQRGVRCYSDMNLPASEAKQLKQLSRRVEQLETARRNSDQPPIIVTPSASSPGSIFLEGSPQGALFVRRHPQNEPIVEQLETARRNSDQPPITVTPGASSPGSFYLGGSPQGALFRQRTAENQELQEVVADRSGDFDSLTPRGRPPGHRRSDTQPFGSQATIQEVRSPSPH